MSWQPDSETTDSQQAAAADAPAGSGMQAVSFDNTEIAFAPKSHTQLRKAYWLFRTLGSPELVKAGKFFSQLAFGLHLPVAPLIRMTLFEHFVGGETIAGCEATIAQLADYGIGSILDYSAEGKADEASFVATTTELIRVLERAATDPRIPFGVFKVTGLGRSELLKRASSWQTLSQAEQAELESIEKRIDQICQAAVAAQTPVMIDAEESWLQPVIDRFALSMMRRYNREKAWVWNTLQMYRHDRLEALKDLLKLSQQEGFQLGFKLVRGAYMEKERAYAQKLGIASPIQPSKAATDSAFDAAVSLCLANIERVSLCAGSHNESSNYQLMAQMQAAGLAPNDPRIWFAQLLGMSDHISFNLAQAGYNVVKYVPYAPIPDLVPYLIRRAEENTSVRGQSGRELQLLHAEMKRRRLL